MAQTSPDDTQDIADPLARLAAIAPIIEDNAEEADRTRRLPEPIVDALHDAGLYRMLLPAQFGGAELSPVVYLQVMEALASLDASTAWCIGQANGCAMSAAYLDPAVSDRIWGQDPRAVLAWGPGPATAVVDGDGYRVTGNWAFASGGNHANWLGGHARIVDADGNPVLAQDGTAAERTFLLPAAEIEMTENWDVIGLRGTGSDSFSAKDYYVSHDYSISRDDPAERRCNTPLYQFPAMSLYAIAFSATALGIARATFDQFLELVGTKRPRLAKQVLRDNHLTQAEAAESFARLSAARAYLSNEVEDIWHEVRAENQVTIEQRMRIRLAATYAIHQAKSVVDTIYDAAGATAIFRTNGFERRFRDMHTVAQQLQGRKGHFQSVGAYMFGHPADMSVI
jgi:alkylation response protein AidB-like acyl-CoA dehydrogenase